MKIAQLKIQKGGVHMLDFTWKVFSKTGNIDTYLLFKQMETEEERPDSHEEELAEVDFPIS